MGLDPRVGFLFFCCWLAGWPAGPAAAARVLALPLLLVSWLAPQLLLLTLAPSPPLPGGFLQLYVLLRSGISLNFSTLLFDSTPILPQPVAFTTFLRAYMHNAGWTIPLKLIPAKVMISIVAWRWRYHHSRTGSNVAPALRSARRSSLLTICSAHSLPLADHSCV